MKKEIKRFLDRIKIGYRIKKIIENKNTILVDKNIYSNLKLNIQGTGNIIKLSNLRLGNKAKLHIYIW